MDLSFGERTDGIVLSLFLVRISGMFTDETDAELAMLFDMRTVEKEMDSENLPHRSYTEDVDPNSETVSFSSSGQTFFLPAVLEISKFRFQSAF